MIESGINISVNTQKSLQTLYYLKYNENITIRNRTKFSKLYASYPNHLCQIMNMINILEYFYTFCSPTEHYQNVLHSYLWYLTSFVK